MDEIRQAIDEIRQNVQIHQLDINGMINRIKAVLPGVLHDHFPGHIGLNNDDLLAKVLAWKLFNEIEAPLTRMRAAAPVPQPNRDINEALGQIILRDTYDLFIPDLPPAEEHIYLQFARMEVQRYNEEQLLLARERLSMATGTIELAEAEGIGEDVSRRILDALGEIPQDRINQSLIQTRPLRAARERLRRAVLAQNMAQDRSGNVVLGNDVSQNILNSIREQPYELFPRGAIPGLREDPVSSSSSIVSSGELARLEAEIAAQSSSSGTNPLDEVDGGKYFKNKRRGKRKNSSKRGKRSKRKNR